MGASLNELAPLPFASDSSHSAKMLMIATTRYKIGVPLQCLSK